MVAGSRDNEVLRLVLDRVARGRDHDSHRRLALVVEGGAMRGTYSGGALLGLHLLGAASVFDHAYATSAGAINLAHFLSGMGHLKAATYYKALADGRFFDPRRLHKPVDIDFVFDVVLKKEFPLEMDKVARSGTVLKVAVLNWVDAQPEMKTISGTDQLAWDTLKASVSMPVVYNRKIPLPGGQYVDGGMAIPYPLDAAIRDGMTDIIVILSQNPTLPVHPRGMFQYILWSMVFAKWRTDLIRVFESWRPSIMRLNRLVTGQIEAPPGVRILAIYPTRPLIKSSTMDKRLLRNGCIEMATEVLQAFGSSTSSLEALVREGTI